MFRHDELVPRERVQYTFLRVRGDHVGLCRVRRKLPDGHPQPISLTETASRNTTLSVTLTRAFAVVGQIAYAYVVHQGRDGNEQGIGKKHGGGFAVDKRGESGGVAGGQYVHGVGHRGLGIEFGLESGFGCGRQRRQFQAAVAQALVEIGSAAAVKQLGAALTDKGRDVRMAAVRALAVVAGDRDRSRRLRPDLGGG